MVSNDYIRGFFDGEGCIQISRVRHYPQPSVKLANTCLPLLLAIEESLRLQGFHPLVGKMAKPQKTTSKQPYELRLCRWSEVIRFYHEVGTEHPDKKPKFEEVIALDKVRPGKGHHVHKTSTVEAVEQMLKHSRRIM